MKVLIATVTFVLIAIIAILQYVTVPGVLEVPLARGEELYAGEGQLCSTFSVNYECQEGLECLTEDGEEITDIRTQTGHCQDPNKINKTN